jgi:hypothetical protein
VSDMATVRVFQLNDNLPVRLAPAEDEAWSGVEFCNNPLVMLLGLFFGEINLFHLQEIELLWKEVGRGAIDVVLNEAGDLRKIFGKYLSLLDAVQAKITDRLGESAGRYAVLFTNSFWGLSRVDGELSVLQVQFSTVEQENGEPDHLVCGLVEVLWSFADVDLSRGMVILEPLVRTITDLQDCLAELDVICEAARRQKPGKRVICVETGR